MTFRELIEGDKWSVIHKLEDKIDKHGGLSSYFSMCQEFVEQYDGYYDKIASGKWPTTKKDFQILIDLMDDL